MQAAPATFTTPAQHEEVTPPAESEKAAIEVDTTSQQNEPSTTDDKDGITKEKQAASPTSTAEDEDEEEDESIYVKGLPLTFLTLGLMLTTFVIALDNTIIATAIPRITTVFNVSDKFRYNAPALSSERVLTDSSPSLMSDGTALPTF